MVQSATVSSQFGCVSSTLERNVSLCRACSSYWVLLNIEVDPLSFNIHIHKKSHILHSRTHQSIQIDSALEVGSIAQQLHRHSGQATHLERVPESVVLKVGLGFQASSTPLS